jgi:hypothetical protein
MMYLLVAHPGHELLNAPEYAAKMERARAQAASLTDIDALHAAVEKRSCAF